MKYKFTKLTLGKLNFKSHHQQLISIPFIGDPALLNFCSQFPIKKSPALAPPLPRHLGNLKFSGNSSSRTSQDEQNILEGRQTLASSRRRTSQAPIDEVDKRILECLLPTLDVFRKNLRPVNTPNEKENLENHLKNIEDFDKLPKPDPRVGQIDGEGIGRGAGFNHRSQDFYSLRGGVGVTRSIEYSPFGRPFHLDSVIRHPDTSKPIILKISHY